MRLRSTMALQLILASHLVLATGLLEAQQPPNIVLINVDDLGYQEITPYGATKQVTPHLTRLANEGRKLMSHYAAPVCSPSRAALMTGCYPKRALPIPHVLFPAAQVGLHPDEVTLAEVLRESGYATACIGKWHLGDQPEFLPRTQGFDYYYGLPYSNDMGLASEGSKSNFGQPLPQPRQPPAKNPVSETGLTGNAQPPLPLMENEQVIQRVTAEQQAALTKNYTEKAVGFIRQQQAKPFFLYLPHTAVHFPLYPDADFRGRSNNGLLGDWIMEVDWSLGEILKVLDELKLADNTLVFFTSDNGGPVNQGANNGALRGAKGSTWEGGIRVPAICRWPGKIPANSSTQDITSMMDLLPTLCQVAGAKLPADRKLDGVNVLSSLTGEGQPARDHFFYFKGLGLEAVRHGDWKLHLEKSELYNLKEDIGESHNLSNEHPAIVAQLRELATSIDADLGMKAVGPGCRPLGRVAAAKPLLE